ncbi:hypothetical protein GS597_13515 [Synechococcales cyanobacterium C]|uniref:DUF7734 domain-containing protein n=1 Tax=Petrachloros mirabilis ULC683 TaxID=2781853 RepID=A0A8K2A160_9CYAN|nr:hypothetical protein [Petrachloros mirabilis]NCJ07507.1 hypothetical protein [Petrachloros mirabilis ULC683]
MTINPGFRLEQYTLKQPQEVLLVQIEVNGEADEIAIFRGMSSSLMRPTAFDLDIPVLPANASIIGIDRLEGPYDPSMPRYRQRGLSWTEFEPLLQAVGV